MSTICGSKRYLNNILIIDDSADDVRLLSTIFRGHPYRISVAFDGKTGMQRAIALQPGLILLDWQMPKMDGSVVCRLLKENPATSTIPVIFISALGTPEQRTNGLRQGAVDYICKPFYPAEVLARVEIQMNKRVVVIEESADSGIDQALMTLAKEIIRDDLACAPSAEQLARKLGSNEKKLSGLFKKYTGNTVSVFIRQEKMQKASQLLSSTAMPVQDIADFLGFDSAANFATAFREVKGISPSAYRKQVSLK